MRIRTKLFVVYLIVVIFLLGSITTVLTQQNSKSMTAIITRNMTQTLSQLSYNLDNKLLSFEQITNSMYLSIPLQNILLTKYRDLPSSYEAYFSYLDPYVSQIQGTQNVYRLQFYTDNPTFTFSNVILLNQQLKLEAWYQALKGRKDRNYWTNLYQVSLSDDRVFSLKQKLGYLDPGADLYASIEITERELTRLVEKESADKRIMFILPNGQVLLDSRQPGAGGTRQTISQYPFAGQMTDQSGHFMYQEKDDSYIVLYQTLNSRYSVNGMKVIMMVPLTNMLQSVHHMKWLAYMLFLLSCVLATGLIFMFSNRLTRRLTQLTRRMRAVHHEEYRHVVVMKGNDEVSQLGQSFNQMVERLNHLINEVYKSELDRKELALRTREAEFYALQAQINPHYLFNVLNMLRGNLLERSDARNAEIVSLLARSFRLLLQSQSELTTLRQELEFVTIYLAIQKYRYEDRLHYIIDASEEGMEVRIPKLSIQPLVENAIIHGMEMNEVRTTVRVSVSVQNRMLRVSVEDDGVGIDPESLSMIHQQLNYAHQILQGEHIGLRNIHFRLIQLFGDVSRLQVTSNNLVTQVTFLVPMAENDMS